MPMSASSHASFHWRRQPLQVGVEEDLLRQFLPRLRQRLGAPLAQRRIPFLPRASLLARVQRPEQRVVVEPPPRAVHEDAQPVRARAVRVPLVRAEVLERGAEDAVLQGADGGVVH